MTLFNSMIRLQMQLFLLMLCGYAVRKLKVITAEQQKGLSSLLINVILPANIIASFTGGIEMSSELLHNAVTAVIISAAVQTASYVLGPLLFGRFDRARSVVMRYGMIVSNSSFIGIPVVETIYGSIGTMYTSVYQIPIRLTMWTLGLALYAGESGSLKQKIIKMLTHPCIVAVGIGFVILVTGIKLPSAVTGTLSSLGRCVSALSMLIIGGILSEIHAGKLADKAILYFTLIRLAAQRQDLPAGKHHLQRPNRVAGDAVFDRPHAPGVGGDVAADGGALFARVRTVSIAPLLAVGRQLHQ